MNRQYVSEATVLLLPLSPAFMSVMRPGELISGEADGGLGGGCTFQRNEPVMLTDFGHFRSVAPDPGSALT